MTKVLARVSEPQNDPIVSIVDLDETKGMVPIGALNGVVKVEMVFLSNEQARSIRKAMDAGLRGEDLDTAIGDILAPPNEKAIGEEINQTGSVPANQDPPAPAPMEPSPEQGNPAPPAGDGNT